MPPLHFLLYFGFIWAIGWLFFPISRRIFGDALPDGGLAVGRVLALVSWTLLAFWAGQLGVSTQWSANVGLGMAVVAFALVFREKSALKLEIRTRKRAIWASETVFVLVFLAFFVLRGFWSDTAGNNGEKAMDSALIGSLMRAERLPPPNPYAAGATLSSYYYFGHLQTALLSDALHIPLRWSYNLMCAALPALCFSSLFALGAALTGRLRGGFIVSASVLGLGTLQPLYQLAKWLYPDKPMPPAPFRLDFFAVSRVLPYSINEFPFFTFNQGDLHAHYFGLPLALATICLAYAIYRGQKAAFVPATLILGAQILTNTWDFPVYALIVAAAIAARREELRRPVWVRAALVPLVWGGAIAVASPYLLRIRTAASLPRALPFPASPMREWLLLWGVFAVCWLAFLAFSDDELTGNSGGKRLFFGIFAALFGVYALAVPWQRPDAFVLPLIGILLLFSLHGARKLGGTARFLCFLAVGGLLAVLWSETTWAGFLGNAADPGFTDYKRQDTVFKFGLQTWITWGVASCCGAVATFKKWPRALQMGLMPALGVMLMASLAVVSGRARGFEKWDGWDAYAHLAPDEIAAATWLLEHVKPGENLLEAEQLEGGDYSLYTRYASATGIPTLVGPQAHTFQWSPANARDAGKEWAEVARRKALARAIYTGFSGASRARAMQSFGARFILFGELERAQYGEFALKSLLRDPELAVVAHFDAAPFQSATIVGAEPFASHEVWIFRLRAGK